MPTTTPSRVDLWLDAYAAGFADGHASRDTELQALERIADYWHDRATNPGMPTPEQRIVDSILDGIAVNEERARKRAELDALEQAKFADARALIAEGKSDMEVAVATGLFFPLIARIRAGEV